jgi:hypothetical protein
VCHEQCESELFIIWCSPLVRSTKRILGTRLHTRFMRYFMPSTVLHGWQVLRKICTCRGVNTRRSCLSSM